MKLNFAHLIWDPNLLAPGAHILVKTHCCVGQGNPAHKHKATLIQNLHETEICASYLGPYLDGTWCPYNCKTKMAGWAKSMLKSTNPKSYKAYMKLKFAHLIWYSNLLALGAHIIVKKTVLCWAGKNSSQAQSHNHTKPT